MMLMMMMIDEDVLLQGVSCTERHLSVRTVQGEIWKATETSLVQ